MTRAEQAAARKSAYAALRAAGYSRDYARRHDRQTGTTLAKSISSTSASRPSTRKQTYDWLRGLGWTASEARRADKASPAELARIAEDARLIGPKLAKAQYHRRAAARSAHAPLPDWYQHTSERMSRALERAKRQVTPERYAELKAETARIREILRVKAAAGPAAPSLEDYRFINREGGFWDEYLGDEDWSELYGSEEVD